MRTALTYTVVVVGLFVVMARGGFPAIVAERKAGSGGRVAQGESPGQPQNGPDDQAEPDDPGLAQPVFQPEHQSDPLGLDASAGQIPLSFFPANPTAIVASLQPERSHLQTLLASGVPGLASAQPKADGAGQNRSGWPPWLAAILPALAGNKDVRPQTLLATVLPVLSLQATHELEPSGHPIEPVPVDPRLFFPLLPGSAGRVPPQQIGEEPLVGFYNSHAYESYISEMAERPARLADVITDDNGKNVVLVSRELAKLLSENHGIATVHSSAHHHLQGYSWSYAHSRLTAERLLEEYPTVRVLIDIHRDSDMREKTVAMIDGVPVARVRLVVGRGGANLDNPRYETTRAFADAIFATMESKYPGLVRDIYEQDTRFNQDLLPACMLLEIGGPENTMEEALRAAALMADVLQEVIRAGEVPGLGR